jgi:hypothetical protein
VPPPCGSCPKIPKGERPHPSNAVELTDANYQAYAHYKRCQAVGRFPVDGTVERNAGLIRMVEDQVGQIEEQRNLNTLAASMMAAAVLRGRR